MDKKRQKPLKKWRKIRKKSKVKFTVELSDGRIARCWRAEKQEYRNCMFSAGLSYDIEPDTIYLRAQKEDIDDTFMFLRPDEALAIIYCLSGALWSLDRIKALESK